MIFQDTFRTKLFALIDVFILIKIHVFIRVQKMKYTMQVTKNTKNNLRKNTLKKYNKMIKHANDQPGMKELMRAYGRYDELIKQSNEYFANIAPQKIIITSNSTS